VTRTGLRASSILLAALIAFAALAVFSPIHKHDLNAPTKCTLNHLDSQQAEGTVVVLPDISLVLVGVSELQPEAERAAHLSESRLPARAPPVSFC
jgi:uncharacterized protein YggE